MRWTRNVTGALTRAAVLLSVWLASFGPSTASILRFMPIEELAGSSSLVVRARIVGQSVHWTENHEGIYTEIEADALDSIKGRPPQRGAADVRRLTIIQAGGVIDGVSLDWTGRPTFRTGEDLILFLQPYDPSDPADSRLLVVGGKQGKMRVIEDPRGEAPVMVERDLAGVLEAPFIEGDEPKGPAQRPDLISLEEVARRVRATGGGRLR